MHTAPRHLAVAPNGTMISGTSACTACLYQQRPMHTAGLLLDCALAASSSPPPTAPTPPAASSAPARRPALPPQTCACVPAPTGLGPAWAWRTRGPPQTGPSGSCKRGAAAAAVDAGAAGKTAECERPGTAAARSPNSTSCNSHRAQLLRHPRRAQLLGLLRRRRGRHCRLGLGRALRRPARRLLGRRAAHLRGTVTCCPPGAACSGLRTATDSLCGCREAPAPPMASGRQVQALQMPATGPHFAFFLALGLLCMRSLWRSVLSRRARPGSPIRRCTNSGSQRRVAPLPTPPRLARSSARGLPVAAGRRLQQLGRARQPPGGPAGQRGVSAAPWAVAPRSARQFRCYAPRRRAASARWGRVCWQAPRRQGGGGDAGAGQSAAAAWRRRCVMRCLLTWQGAWQLSLAEAEHAAPRTAARRIASCRYAAAGSRRSPLLTPPPPLCSRSG